MISLAILNWFVSNSFCCVTIIKRWRLIKRKSFIRIITLVNVLHSFCPDIFLLCTVHIYSNVVSRPGQRDETTNHGWVCVQQQIPAGSTTCQPAAFWWALSCQAVPPAAEVRHFTGTVIPRKMILSMSRKTWILTSHCLFVGIVCCWSQERTRLFFQAIKPSWTLPQLTEKRFFGLRMSTNVSSSLSVKHCSSVRFHSHLRSVSEMFTHANSSPASVQ